MRFMKLFIMFKIQYKSVRAVYSDLPEHIESVLRVGNGFLFPISRTSVYKVNYPYIRYDSFDVSNLVQCNLDVYW